MSPKGWYSRGYLPHFDPPETTQFVTRPDIAKVAEAALLHFDGDRYHLLAWCIMPNHVHVIVGPRADNPLHQIVHSWKSFTAHQANRMLGRSGVFWHRDYFDRYIRDEGHLSRTIDYVENNPVKAGLASEPAKWRWSSARLRA